MDPVPEPTKIFPKGLNKAPLTHSQESLWFLQKLNPGNTAYHSNLLLRFQGPLNTRALEEAIRKLIVRHEPLRTCYPYQETGPVAVIGQAVEFQLSEIDLSLLTPREKKERSNEVVNRLASQPYDLQKGPMYRAVLLRLSEGESLLFFGMHHIGSDAWSREVLRNEILQIYANLIKGEPTKLPDLPVAYSDYACWQREWMQGDILERYLAHWTQALSGELPTLDLPLDFHRPVEQTYDGAHLDLPLTTKHFDAVRQFCRQERITPFHFFLSAYAILLSRYSGQDELLIGCPFANRHTPELENMIGLFINTLPIRINLSDDPTVRSVVVITRDLMVDAYTWSALPFEALVARLSPERDLSRTPVYQVSINMRNVLRFDQPELPGLLVEKVTTNDTQTPLDLSLEFEHRGAELFGYFKYNTNLFKHSTMETIARHFLQIVDQMLFNPDCPVSMLQMLSDAERVALTAGSSHIRTNFPSETVHVLFSKQVANNPAGKAVLFNQKRLTYQELENRSNQLANHLLENGLVPNSIVAILLPRSEVSIISLLAVLKAGCAFMPVDTLSPMDRLVSIFSESSPSMVITEEKLQAQIPPGYRTICLDKVREQISRSPSSTPLLSVNQNSLMHIMFTSGSTGKPKGIRNEHRGFVNYMDHVIRKFHFTTDDRILQHTAFSWDASLFEVFVSLLSGGTMVMLDENQRSNPTAIVNTIFDQKITTLKVVPTLLRAICETVLLVGNPNHNLHRLFSVGEPLLQKDIDLIRQAFGSSVEIINQYGPTECSGVLTDFVIPQDYTLGDLSSVPIGKPIQNNRLYLLDRHQNPVPAGVKGEITLAGVGVGRGYLGKPELDLINFLPDPFFPGEKMYRTGDIGVRLADGNFAFLGRNDHQVKIRGYRVELSEIESALADFPGISEVAVLLSGSGDTAKLIAYLCSDRPANNLTLEQLREFLSKRLPFYMIPTEYVFLEKLPLTASGKIDRNKLPLPSDSSKSKKVLPPGNDTEKRMLVIWKEIFQDKEFGVTDNFFHLGGHSLLAIRLMAKIEKEFGKTIPLVELFQRGTITDLSKLIDSSQQKTINGVVPVKKDGEKTPIYIISSGINMKNLGEALTGEHPVYLLFAYQDGKPTYGQTVQETAVIYYRLLTQFQPKGPYCLLGHSADGQFALELARILLAERKEVEFLGLIDSYPPLEKVKINRQEQLKFYLKSMEMKNLSEKIQKIYRSLRWRLIKFFNTSLGKWNMKKWAKEGKVRRVKHYLMKQYVAERYHGDMTYFSASYDMVDVRYDRINQWKSIVEGKLSIVPVLGDHSTVIHQPFVTELGKKIMAEIDKDGLPA